MNLLTISMLPIKPKPTNKTDSSIHQNYTFQSKQTLTCSCKCECNNNLVNQCYKTICANQLGPVQKLDKNLTSRLRTKQMYPELSCNFPIINNLDSDSCYAPVNRPYSLSNFKITFIEYIYIAYCLIPPRLPMVEVTGSQ